MSAAQRGDDDLAEAFPDATVLVDREGRIVGFNTLAERMLGHRRADVLGRALEVLIPAPARERHRAHVAAFGFDRARAMGEGAELRARCADGRELPVEISLGPVRVGGVEVVAASIRDVSARRALEARLEAARSEAARARDVLDGLLRALPEAVALVGADGRVRFSNGRFPEPTPDGSPWPGGPPDSLAAWIHARLPAARAEAFAEEAVSRGRAWSLQGWAVGDDVLVVARDVTETRRLEAGLLAADRLRSMGMLAATVAHEINNPLAALLANLELAELPGAPVGELVRDAWLAGEQIRVITRDLGVFSRSDDDPGGPVDLHVALDSALRLADHLLRSRATVLRRYGELPPVSVPASRLGQVFLNLLVNAAQAIPPGAPDRHRVTVTTRHDGGRVRIDVADTGAGMDDAVRSRLFSPFFTTKPAGEGTGLGLAICLRLVREAGGDVSVASEPGRGSTFTVTLPVHPT